MIGLMLMLATPNPLAPASEGKMQCYHPDRARRTCRSLASYVSRADGGYDNKAVVLLSATPAVVMTTVTPVVIEGDAVCGAIRPEDLASAEIEVNSSMLSGDALADARQRIAAAMGGVLGDRICTRYTVDGDALTAEATINGTPRPDATDTVIWVSPADGYRVAP